jgi:hypothetical protein
VPASGPRSAISGRSGSVDVTFSPRAAREQRRPPTPRRVHGCKGTPSCTPSDVSRRVSQPQPMLVGTVLGTVAQSPDASPPTPDPMAVVYVTGTLGPVDVNSPVRRVCRWTVRNEPQTQPSFAPAEHVDSLRHVAASGAPVQPRQTLPCSRLRDVQRLRRARNRAGGDEARRTSSWWRVGRRTVAAIRRSLPQRAGACSPCGSG